MVAVVWKENPLEGVGFEKLNPPPGFDFVQSIFAVECGRMQRWDRKTGMSRLR